MSIGCKLTVISCISKQAHRKCRKDIQRKLYKKICKSNSNSCAFLCLCGSTPTTNLPKHVHTPPAKPKTVFGGFYRYSDSDMLLPTIWIAMQSWRLSLASGISHHLLSGMWQYFTEAGMYSKSCLYCCTKLERRNIEKKFAC